MVTDPNKRCLEIQLETNVDTEMKLERVAIEQYTVPLCEWVDGHFLPKALDSCVAIIVLVDGMSFSPASCASLLFHLFTNKSFLANPLPVLFAVNKSDNRKALHNSVVYSQIEQEVGLMMDCENYTFKEYSPCTIYACNCSIQADSYGSLLEFVNASL